MNVQSDNVNNLSDVTSSVSVGKTVETAFNFALASVLRSKHPDWRAEGSILAERLGVLQNEPRKRPDIIIFHPRGIPVAIETEFQPARNVEKEAKERLGKVTISDQNSIEQSIAVKVPKEVAKADQSNLEGIIKNTKFEICVFSLELNDTKEPLRWPESGWFEGNIDDLATISELSTSSENVFGQGMQILENMIENTANQLRKDCRDSEDTLAKIAEILCQRDSLQTTRMAMSILVNAIMLHNSIAGSNKIENLDEIWEKYDGVSKKQNLIRVWKHIMEKINYVPIFKTASRILIPIQDQIANNLLTGLRVGAQKLESLGVTSRHDMCGRMFQSLITDRKFLATFYTLPTSSALLANIALDNLGEINWSNEYDVKSLKIADFACGTGALLSATYRSVLARFNRSRWR